MVCLSIDVPVEAIEDDQFHIFDIFRSVDPAAQYGKLIAAKGLRSLVLMTIHNASMDRS